jgi:predicted HicB family RNase H-like nuclease
MPLSNEDRMTIARIPKQYSTDIQSEDAFIQGKPTQAMMGKRANKTSVMLRIDPELLADINREAKAAGLTRSAWIHSTLTKAARTKG